MSARILILALTFSPIAAAQELRPECEGERAVKQASLYAENGDLAAARGELEMALRTRRGAEQAEVWLAYGLVTFEQGDLDTAGLAVDRVYALNEAGAVAEMPPWAERFLNRFETQVGRIVFEDAEARRISFSVQYESGPEPDRARAVIEREGGRLARTTLTPVVLPVGVYQLGATRVEVRPASERPVVVEVENLGPPALLAAAARAAAPAPPFPVTPSPFLERCEERALPTLATAPPEAPGFFFGPWPWVLGGLLLAAGAGAAAAVATHEPGWRLSFAGEAEP